ncbi:DinB family protein [Bacillus mangrovi]|uniref:DinB family protein n=1 Tax=Metabacillus mangrovi TaxID=1491830 RepID=A0A7X2V525_9BACI|nr:DinB family protein [Metabacillus mangrovi]MTH54372.1 DinB family protein [Metabacillus mangrovi]
MKHPAAEQFKMVRKWTIEAAESIPQEQTSVQLEDLNNTIQWQLGHILTAAEYFIFRFHMDSPFRGSSYNEWFAPGTKPSDWKGNPPETAKLIEDLKEQLKRFDRVPVENWKEGLAEPAAGGFKTYEECASYAVLHESLHTGEIKAIAKLLKKSGVSQLRWFPK